jgi:hypothetical protein
MNVERAFKSTCRTPSCDATDMAVEILDSIANTKNKATMTDEPTQPEDLSTLYRHAFEQFGVSAVWSSKSVSDPTPADALAITRSLRTCGGMEGRRLGRAD